MKTLLDNGNHVPRTCVFEVTLRCNINCRHCGSSAGEARQNELSTDEITDIMKQLSGLGCRKVNISGGEALMRPDWPQIVEASSGAGMETALITNGLLFDREAARRARAAGLTTIAFSLDGIGQEHNRFRRFPGLYERVIGGMDAAASVGLNLCAVTSIHKQNMGSLRKIRDILVEKDAFAWQVQPAVSMGELCHNSGMGLRPADIVRICSDVAELIEEDTLRIDVGDSLGYFGPHEKTLRSRAGDGCFGGCQAGKKIVGIESDGSVKGCLSIQPGRSSGRAKHHEGNVRLSSLKEIWERSGAFAYSREWTIEDLAGFCRDCQFAERCRGGCRSVQVASGDGVENPMCVYRVLSERRVRVGSVQSAAAAAVMSAFLGIGFVGCDSNREVHPVYGVSDVDSDTDSDGDTDTDSDSDTDTDADTDTDTESGTDTDTDSETESDSTPDGGVDSGVDAG